MDKGYIDNVVKFPGGKSPEEPAQESAQEPVELGVTGEPGQLDEDREKETPQRTSKLFVAETALGTIAGVPLYKGAPAQTPGEVFSSMAWVDTFQIKIAQQTRNGAQMFMEPLNTFNRKSNVSFLNPSSIYVVYEADENFKKLYLENCIRVKAAMSGIITPNSTQAPIHPDGRPLVS